MYVPLRTDLLGGLAIIYLEVCWIDPVLTLVIARYVLYQALTMLPKAARILMGAAPPGIDFDEVVRAMEGHDSVQEIHHLHI